MLHCIYVQGYNYRESLKFSLTGIMRRRSTTASGGKLAGSGAILKAALFPLRYFRKVENVAFDFENNSNDLLHCIGDELVCETFLS